MPRFLSVDPRTLFLPTQRLSGADPWKLQRQIAQYGSSIVGLPPIWVEEDPGGRLRIVNGTTRAVRVAKLLPGCPVIVEVIAQLKKPIRTTATVADAII